MILTLQRLFEGVMETLEKEVAPQVSSSHARAQLYACLDLLNNVSDKVEWKRQMLLDETTGIEAALGTALPLLEKLHPQGPVAEIKAAIERAVHTADADDLAARQIELNQLLEDLILVINRPELARAADTADLIGRIREAIHAHLRNQVIRDAMYLKPMMLKKISQA